MLRSFFSDIFFLLFPKTCNVCSSHLRHGEDILCTNCIIDLPVLHENSSDTNSLETILWGQVHFQKATSLLLYSKNSAYAQLLHQLKYNNRQDIGLYLGQMLGVELKRSGFCNTIDCIVPIPLHKKRFKERGYNQSEIIAQGISNITGIKVITNAVERTVYTKTQTKKNKEERLKNVENIFKITQGFENKHILLVDDIITTGATIISCGNVLLQESKNCLLSIASVGVVE